MGLTVYLRSAVVALLAVAAAFFVSRRLAGALEVPLRTFQLLVAGLLLAGLAQIAHAPMQMGRFRVGGVLVSLAMFALAASLSLPGSNAAALLWFWAVIVGGELWVWRGILPARLGLRRAEWAPTGHRACMVGGGRRVPDCLPITSPRTPAPVANDLSEDLGPLEPAADVLQQLTLRRTEGGQQLSGWLRMPLAAGQRTGNLHVAFCPPFGQVPQVQAEAVSGPDCRIKAAQVLPYGARLDVKLDEPAAEGEGVLVWFFARSEG